MQVAEQPFGGTAQYPAVGLSSVGEEVRLIDAAALWGIESETESETGNHTAEAVRDFVCR